MLLRSCNFLVLLIKLVFYSLGHVWPPRVLDNASAAAPLTLS